MHTSEKIDIGSMTLDNMKEFMLGIAEPSYRAKQVFEWLHLHFAASWDDMKNIPNSLKEKLNTISEINGAEIYNKYISEADGTRKYVLKLHDGNLIESVFMRYKHGNSVCVSSQVGCAMGCKFCASTINGFVRNLTPYEILSQVYRICADTDERISNIVIMGMGEPLLNYENIVFFIT